MGKVYVYSDDGAGDGVVRAYSGRTGSSLYHWTGPHITGSIGTMFGEGLLGDFDIDDDGRPEVCTGAPPDEVGGKNSGTVFTYSLEHFHTDLSPKRSFETGFVDVQMAQTDPGKLIGLALVAFDGSPLFSFLAFAPTDSHGSFLVSGQIPFGTSGHNFDFQSFAIGFNGKIVASNIEHLEVN
jgi:hypothetical protein